MRRHDRDRRRLLSAFALVPLAGLVRAAPAAAEPALPPLAQPPEPSKAAFLARARALRDQAVREGDQAYGAVVVRNGVIVGEGRNYVVLHTDPTAHSELLAVRDAARRLGTRDLSDCDVYSTATPCAMCQGALYWARVRRVFTESTWSRALRPSLGAREHFQEKWKAGFPSENAIDERRVAAARDEPTSRRDCARWAGRTGRAAGWCPSRPCRRYW